MCGILGIYNYSVPDQPADRDLLARMATRLSHRGPDGEGFHVDGPLGLGHRRLAIVDLSPAGAQPMSTADGRCWISYNGEFYNHASFRHQLTARGCRFRGTSDTETLLYLLQSEGPDVLRRVAGIFAFAYWDASRRSLLLARDPLGVKQLYYHDDGRRILFASEIKALLESPDVPRVADSEAINEYLHFHTPLFDRTFFHGIKQLKPGEWIEIRPEGKRRRRYWEVTDFEPLEGRPQEIVEELSHRLEDVVKDQLMSDVPVGAFFSGGIDSTAAAAFAARTGKPPHCFGIHFMDQGVIDERSFQEAAAKSLGLELDLITLDGSTFRDDLMNLIYQQDEPVIGSAMIPMYHVSRLASARVKVCLGGQAADEIFGGYARYGLTQPWTVMSTWFRDRRSGGAEFQETGNRTSGNLWKQVSELSTLRRLPRSLHHPTDWKSRYFDHFAAVDETSWRSLFADGIVSRPACRDIFQDTISRSPARHPADAAMHWELQTYLTGLFHQDDRMSMANGLESRVPFADPRLVSFAFKIGFDLKFRGGATKWILRQAVARLLPKWVLTRRKVGFDTPAERWIRGPHAGFVRDLLLSPETRRRGFWNPEGLEQLLKGHHHPLWIDRVWKVLCIEAWARRFLDTPAAIRKNLPSQPRSSPRKESAGISEWIQEVRDLGLRNALYRTRWEIGVRSGLFALTAPEAPPSEAAARSTDHWLHHPPPYDPDEVAAVLRDRIPAKNLEALERTASQAVQGRLLCFGRWSADFGDPPDWHLEPVTRNRWGSAAHWSAAMTNQDAIGDVKRTWEAGRFPHAYHLARAAAFHPARRGEFFTGLARHINSFVEANPYPNGVHWNSGQEIAFRLLAWHFSLRLFAGIGAPVSPLLSTVTRSAVESGTHLLRHIDFARKAVPNNHLLSEALGLLLASHMAPFAPGAKEWKTQGLEILDGETDRQVYPDGAYLQNSHNYHRLAMQIYLVAGSLQEGEGDTPRPAWRGAMERSLDFLSAHQNPADGRLPNYGANDGALPTVLSTCDFSDFRPTLQALSIAVRGERMFEPGPWDEAAAWLLGTPALERPLRRPSHHSISFPGSGYHVLRGNDDSNFAAFRCGTVRDRFSQIDMLHLDVWWKGGNVLADGGSYLYNGPKIWHDHFVRTSPHNTVQIDGRDQMLHYRQFKHLYWTQARLLRFEDRGDYGVLEGEHYGYRRHGGGCVHRRAVLFIKDNLWIVMDTVTGEGRHTARLHWLCGDAPTRYLPQAGRLELQTPDGLFSVTVLDQEGRPQVGDVVAGQNDPPRGWLSRYYGEKLAVSSLAVVQRGVMPISWISLLCAGVPRVKSDGPDWSAQTSDAAVSWRMTDGRFDSIQVRSPS